MRNKYESLKSVKLCENRCVICNWCEFDRNGSPLVEGAHVKPWKSDENADNFDNIIALCPNHHRQFDSLLFYINPQTLHTVFRDTSSPYHDIDLSGRIGYIKREYLAYRQYMFEKEEKLVRV